MVDSVSISAKIYCRNVNSGIFTLFYLTRVHVHLVHRRNTFTIIIHKECDALQLSVLSDENHSSNSHIVSKDEKRMNEIVCAAGPQMNGSNASFVRTSQKKYLQSVRLLALGCRCSAHAVGIFINCV